MKKIAFLGFLVFLMPFLGFPIRWENIIYNLLGLIILLQSLYFLWKMGMLKKRQKRSLKNNIYTENDICSTQGE